MIDSAKQSVRVRVVIILALSVIFAATASPLSAQNGDVSVLVSPNALTFDYVIGGVLPPAQPVTITSEFSTVSHNFALSSPDNWVTFNPTNGSTPQTVDVGVNPAGLGAGTYTSTLVVSAFAKNTPVVVEIVLNVTPAPPPPPKGTLSASPAALTFNYVIGTPQSPGLQSVAVTASTALTFNASPSDSWITLNPASATTPAALAVGVNPVGLAAGTYSGSITITSANALNSPQIVNVELIVKTSASTNTLASVPSSLQFDAIYGSPAPPSQSIALSANVSLQFTVSKSAPWITLGTTSGLTPASVQVGVNPNALIPGTYYGFVTIEAIAGNSPLTIPLVLNVASQPGVLVVSPKVLNFRHASGSVQPPSTQAFSVLGSVPTGFTVVASQSWVKLNVSGGITPASVQVGVDPATLAVGTYSATITVSSGVPGTDETVSVVLEVMPAPLPQLSADPTPLVFNYVLGSGQPAPQVLTVSGSLPIQFAATTPAAFVSLNAASGITTASITVRINPAGLIPGRYDTSLTISGLAANSPLTVPIVLYVTSTPASILTAAPAVLMFDYAIGGVQPQSRALLLSGSSNLNFTASSSAAWAIVNPLNGTTPGSLQVSVNPAGLNPGIYFAAITIDSPSAINAPQSVVVVLNVYKPSNQGIFVSPSVLHFNYVLGASQLPPTQTVLVSAANPSGFAVSATTSWLTVDKNAGTTPEYLGIGINPSGLSAGVYSGRVIVTGSNAQAIDVTLNVMANPAPSFTVSPSLLTFIYLTGVPVPSPQAVTVDGPGIGFSASIAASWLKLDRPTGTAPGIVNVSVDPRGLIPGVYNSAIRFVASGTNDEQTVQVRLLVDPTFSVDPRVLLFNYSIGSAPPTPQTLFISGTSQLKVSRFVSDKWILTADSGQDVVVTVDPAGLPVGVYNGTIVIDAAGTPETPYVVLVTLVVNPGPTSLTVGPPELDFRYVIGSSPPASQVLAVDTVDHQPVAFSVRSNSAWIVPDIPVGLSPALVQVLVDPTGLKTGSYEGVIEIRAPGVQGAPQTVTIRLTVSASAPAITVTPANLTFVHTLNAPGSAPAAQTLLLTSNAGLSFADNATTSWLSLSTTSGSTTGSIAVSVNPQGLGEGTYSGAVEIQSGTSVQSIPVTLVVRNAVPEFRLTPHLLVFEYSPGSAFPSPAKLSVTSTTSTVANVSVPPAAGGAWITLSSSTVTAPGAIEIGVNPSSLAAGIHLGSVSIVAPGVPNGNRTVAVVLIVRATNELVVSATDLEFTQYIGGPKPPAQPLTIQSGLPTTFRASLLTSSGSPWLTVSPGTGQTPATMDVGVNGAGLRQGIHNGHIIVTGTNAANVRSVHVTLSMKSASLAVTPGLLDFEYQIGGALPLPQTVSVGAPVPAVFTLSTVSAGNWLSGNLTGVGAAIRVNPTGLQPGVYLGTVVINAPVLNTTRGVAVRLKVTSPGVTVSPTSLVFDYLIGSPLPAATQVSVTNGTAAAFSASPSTSSGGNWLKVNPSTGTTPATVSVTVDPTNVSVGTYTGSIVFQSGAANGGTTTLPVELRVRSITITAVGLPDIVTPTQQLPFAIQTTTPSSQPLSGSLVLMFAPNVAIPCAGTCDEMLQFATGGRTLAFSIPANQSAATFSVPSPSILIGTTAGTVTLVAQIQNGPAIPLKTMTINRSAPRVVQLEVARNASGFEVRVTGYSTSRQITSVVFRFEQRAGSVLQTTEVQVTPSLFDAWFRSAEAGPLGGQFRYVQPFAITGDPNAIGSVTVILGNDQGTTTSNAVPFPQ